MTHHLAQLNIGRLKAELGDPLVRDFMVSIDRATASASGYRDSCG